MGASLFFNQTKNGFELIRSLKTGGITESTYQNVSSNRTIGISSSSSLRLSRWTFNTNHMVSFVTLSRDMQDRSVNGVVSSHYLSVGYKFLPSFSGTLSGTLNAGQVNYQSTLRSPQWYSLLLTHIFNNGKLAVSLRLDNFATPQSYSTQVINDDYFRQTSRNYFPLFLTRAAISYKFGKKIIQEPNTKRLTSDN